MFTLLVFLPPRINFNKNEFMAKQCEEDGVVDVQIMSSVEGNLFYFAVITYRDEAALNLGMTFFRSCEIYNVLVNLDKRSTIQDDNQSTQMPSVSNLLPIVASYDVTEILNTNKSKCNDIFQQYKQTKNLDEVIHSLTTSRLISDYIEFFVSSLLLKGLDDNTKVLIEIGTLFTELVNKKVFSIDAVNKGINLVLKDWIDHLSNYPYFLPHIAFAIAPLLLNCGFYDFYRLKDALKSLSPDVSSILIMEIFKIILDDSEQFKSIRYPGGIVGLYYKWTISDNVTLEQFMPCDKLNKYFKNDRLGVFCLSMAIYDEMKGIHPKQVYPLMCKWIESHISSDIIDDPVFVRALTIASVFINLKHFIPFNKFFNYITGELLAYFIKLKPNEFSQSQIQAREIQCLYGIQIATAVMSHPQNLVLNLFVQLFRQTIVSIESFNIWKDENQYSVKFIEDQETKKMALATFDWNNLLHLFASNNNIE